MFRKVLVANRGEIAVRIMRTCERMGIATVAVYSDADWNAPHVRHAGEAVAVGPAHPALSYLNIDSIISAARSTGADAIHPGYGFLSENPDLPDACAAAGIAFAGPTPAAMRMLGDKMAARALARRNGVPVLPGLDISDRDGAITDQAVATIGLPLMVKAPAGGGGRGMRLVTSAAELPEAMAAARREATAAFGDGRLFIESAVAGGRHIEVQVIADHHGNAIHLGERDCSTQRRHQKVIEESPAPGLSADLRGRLTEAAITMARAAGYTNAGTVEFLLDRDCGFYFLEVNTRLQVEHPVTEMVTGLDLVELQLRVAAGEHLPVKQDQVRAEGHAIECRVTAEDPERGHLPGSGRVSYFLAPALEGVRVDSGIESGSAVPAEYDSLLAKVIAHAPTRAQAIERCVHALSSIAIDGVKTNLGLLDAVLQQPSFRDGTHDLTLLESMNPAAFAIEIPDEALIAAAASDMSPAGDRRDPWEWLGAWRGHGPARMDYGYHGRTVRVDAVATGRHTWRFAMSDRCHDVEFGMASDGYILLQADGQERRWLVRTDGAHITLEQDGRRYTLSRVPPSASHARGGPAGARAGQMRAPMPGVVVRVLVANGDDVSMRQPLVVLEAMKMEHIIESSIDGVVQRVLVAAGQRVAEGDILVEVTSGPENGDAPA